MAKILVTDFFGTLVPYDSERADRRFGNHINEYDPDWHARRMNSENTKYVIDKMNLYLSRLLIPFLEEGNRFVIATSAEGHDAADKSYQEIISKMLKLVSAYQEQVSLYFEVSSTTPDAMEDLKKIATIYEQGGNLYAKAQDGATISIVNHKADVFDRISIGSDELFALGDDMIDFQMFVKCMQLGGKSSMIHEFLLDGSVSADDIIRDSISRDRTIALMKYVREKYPFINDKKGLLDALLRVRCHKDTGFEETRGAYTARKRNEYYGRLNNGTLDLLDERRKNLLFYKIRLYNSIFAEEKLNAIIDPEVWFESVDMYPAFGEYYRKVLAKK